MHITFPITKIREGKLYAIRIFFETNFLITRSISFFLKKNLNFFVILKIFLKFKCFFGYLINSSNLKKENI